MEGWSQVMDGLTGHTYDVGVQHYGTTALANLLDDPKIRLKV